METFLQKVKGLGQHQFDCSSEGYIYMYILNRNSSTYKKVLTSILRLYRHKPYIKK